MSVTAAVLCICLAAVGATVQGSVGLGFGLLSAPLLAIVDTEFIPGAVLVAVLPLSVWVALASFRDIDHRGAAVALAGRVPGVIAGAAITAVLSQRALALGLSAAVLIAVALSLWSPPMRVSPTTTAGAGALSGFMGTSTGVGGPPMALLYQHSEPRMVRATLAAFFTTGTVMSIVAQLVAGNFTARQARLGALLLPGVAIGIVLSELVARRLQAQRFRAVLLGLCGASAVALAVRQLV